MDGVTIGISRFGASAPGKVIYDKLELTAQHVVDEALRLVKEEQDSEPYSGDSATWPGYVD